MRRLLSILLVITTLWLPAQAQQTTSSPCKAPALPYTTGELQDIEKSYNREYWDGKLPAVTVVWTALNGKRFGETHQDENGRFVIRLDVLKNREQLVAKTTLLHEMAHVKTWGDTCHVEGQPDNCRRWLAEIHRIMLEGAFDDLV